MLAKTFASSLVLVIAVSFASPTVNPGLREVTKIFVEPTGKDPSAFDKQLQFEIIKQFQGAVALVDKIGDANAILKGESAAVDPNSVGMGKKVTGKFGLNDVGVGSLVLYKKSDRSVILWMERAGDRYFWIGPMTPDGAHKIAERLIKKLRRDFKAAH